MCDDNDDPSSTMFGRFHELPSELLVHIFSMLPTNSDILQCGLVCKKWAEASQTPSLHRRTTLVFTSDEQLTRGIKVFSDYDSNRDLRQHIYSRISVSDSYLTSLEAAPEALLSSLTSLELARCQTTEKGLTTLLSKCSQLRSLSLIELSDVFMAGSLLSSQEDVLSVRQALNNVTHLDLSHNRYMSDALFNRLVSCMENLDSLVLDHCSILSHSGAYKKYYPEGDAVASPSIFSFQNLLKFVRSRSDKLKRLSFYGSSIDGLAVQDMAKIEGLKLEELNLGRCSGVSQDAMIDLARSASGKTLKVLNLDFCRRVLMDYPATSLAIFQEFHGLTSLSLRGLTVPSILVNCLGELKQLKSLDCSDLDSLGSSLAEGLAASGSHLDSLILRGFAFSPEVGIQLTKHLPNLTKLDLTNCQEAVDDSVLGAICQSLKMLRSLKLRNCRRLTDMGFAGSCAEMSADQTKDGDGQKIFLGSKAEAAILNDADVKSKQERIQLLLERQVELRGCGISNLKRLSELDVSYVVGLTDFSLKLAFNFDDLRSLDLSGCRAAATDSGLAAVAVANPHLEKLILSDCRDSLTDGEFGSTISHLPRLLELDVSGQSRLTPSGLLLLPEHCRLLRRLDVSFCSGLGIAALEALEKLMPHLRKFMKRGLYIQDCLGEESDGDDGEAVIPPAPPMPKQS